MNCLQVEVEQALAADVSLALDVVLSWCGDYPGLERLYMFKRRPIQSGTGIQKVEF